MPQLPLSCEARGKFPVQLQGLLQELSPGPLTPEARIMPLDQAAYDDVPETETHECTPQWGDTQPASD